MGPLLYFAVLVIQVSSILTTNEISLKCFLQNNGALNIVSASPSFHNIPEFETIKVDSVSFNKDGWSHEANDLEYFGLKDSLIDDFGFNFKTNISHIIFHTNMFLTYKYKSTGTLFSLPNEGEGIGKVALGNIQFGVIMPFGVLEQNGNNFIQLKSFNTWYDVRDNATFEFTNLFYGNEDKRVTIHSLMNSNWKFLTIRFGEVFMDKVAEKVFNVFKAKMLKVSLKKFAAC